MADYRSMFRALERLKASGRLRRFESGCCPVVSCGSHCFRYKRILIGNLFTFQVKRGEEKDEMGRKGNPFKLLL